MSNIAVIGAGAIGSTLGAFLSRAGHSVTLIGRSAHVEVIQQEGLQVEGVFGTFKVQVAATETLDFQPEFALLAVKTQDVLSTVQANQRFLTRALVVTFQNGVRSDELVATMIPASRIISTVVNLSASYLTPGTVTVLYPGSFVIGHPFAPVDDRVKTVAAILQQVAPTRVSANIRGAHWLKLIINLNNALPALTDTSIAQVYGDPYLRQLGVQMMREGLHVAKCAGIQLVSLPDAPVLLIRLVGRLPVALAGRILARSVQRLERRQPVFGSTHQSLRRGRTTEIDYLNGEIVRVGEQLKVPTPFNAGVVDLVHQVEQTGAFLTMDTIRAALDTRVRRTPAG
jgi:2-dehydropantoate 2-reductase